MKNTQDLSKFGYREIDIAGKLLCVYAKKDDNNKTHFFGQVTGVEFNPNSGNVFLVDEDYNIAMMNGDKLEDFFFCPECGHEGFLEDMDHEGNEGCQEYLKSIC